MFFSRSFYAINLLSLPDKNSKLQIMKFDLMKKVAAVGIAASLSGCNVADMEEFVDKLYDRMSQQERIAQLRSGYMDELFDDKGALDEEKCRELIPFGIGHFSQYASQKTLDPNVLRDRVAAVQDWLMDNTSFSPSILAA